MEMSAEHLGVDRTRALSVKTSSTLRDAILVMDGGGLQVALVEDDSGHLAGLLSDGDVRRALLRGASLSDSTESAMRANPVVIEGNPSIKSAYSVMKKQGLRQVPFVDSSGRLTGLVVEADLLHPAPALDSSVLIMAGGRGLRLGRITESKPKPMVTIGDKPLLEIIIERCVASGFKDFFISVGYLGSHIRDYFGDGSHWGIGITYLEESEPLGTAGALSLLPRSFNSSLVVVNGDVLTNMDLSNMLLFHNERKSSATLGVREHAIQIPFGVVESEQFSVTGIVEKPVVSHFVSAGVYVLEPEVIRSVPQGQYLDMPDLLSNMIASGHEVSAFPLHEDWLDVGSPENLDAARREWSNQ